MAKMRQRTQKQIITTGKQYVLGLFVLLSVLTFSILYALEVSGRPFAEAKEKAVELASQYAGLTSATQVAIYNGAATYYSVVGKTDAGEELLVLIPEEGQDILVYPLAAGLSQEEAEAVAQENGAESIDRAILGYAGGKPIWEIKSKTTYYLIEFETGDLLKKEGI